MEILNQLVKPNKIDSQHQIGDYVFVCKYFDADPNDPWAINHIEEIGKDRKGWFVRVANWSRKWRFIKCLNADEGASILKFYKLHELSPVKHHPSLKPEATPDNDN